MLKFVITVVLLHQVWMKPTGLNKDVAKENIRLEEELETESKNPTRMELPDTSEDEVVGDWGNAASGIDVGNVIRDVLLTLRDHPEIVRKLIADEEKSLAQKVLSSQGGNMDLDDQIDNDDLVLPVQVPPRDLPVQVPPRDFQLPSPQLQQAPKRVVKKMGTYNYELRKRQKETPEETIDMTNLVEGGSDISADSKQLSSDETHPKDDKLDLVEGGSDTPVAIGLNGLKRSGESSSESEEDKSKEQTDRTNPLNNEDSESDELQQTKAAQYWKEYKDRRQKLNGQSKGDYWKKYGKQKSIGKQSKGEFWKNYGKQKHDRKQDENEHDYHGKESLSKAQYWKNYGQRKDDQEESNGTSNESIEDSKHENDRTNNSEQENINHSDSRPSSEEEKVDTGDDNEVDLYQLTKQGKQQSVM